jgi:hypothetical protein
VLAVFVVLVPAPAAVASLALMIETIRIVAKVGMTAEMTLLLALLSMLLKVEMTLKMKMKV